MLTINFLCTSYNKSRHVSKFGIFMTIDNNDYVKEIFLKYDGKFCMQIFIKYLEYTNS